MMKDDTAPDKAPGVGALLRGARLRLGEDIQDVARVLYIRYSYLSAIEEGRFQDLPGATYAVGFVRSYAEHLGLDADEIVRRFKSESSSLRATRELVFPAPISEGGVPGGAVLFVGLLLAAVVYGGWYISSIGDRFAIDLVPALPDRLAALLDGIGGSEEGSVPAAARAAPSEASAAASGLEAPGSVEARNDQPAPTGGATTPLAETPSAELAASGASPEVPAASTVLLPGTVERPAAESDTVAPVIEAARAEPPMTPLEPADAVPAAARPDAPLAQSVPAAPAPEVSAAKKPDPSEATKKLETVEPARKPRQPEVADATSQNAVSASPVPAAGPRSPATVEKLPPLPPEAPSGELSGISPADSEADESPDQFVSPSQLSDGVQTAEAAPGTPDAGHEQTRILVRAKAPSWIQVRDDVAKQLLLTRLLQAGETYQVPDRAGLKLLTANAGALEVMVDGKTVPAIGPVGAVRRDVALDAERLKKGTASDN